jgi:hypothetical protein
MLGGDVGGLQRRGLPRCGRAHIETNSTAVCRGASLPGEEGATVEVDGGATPVREREVSDRRDVLHFGIAHASAVERGPSPHSAVLPAPGSRQSAPGPIPPRSSMAPATACAPSRIASITAAAAPSPGRPRPSPDRARRHRPSPALPVRRVASVLPPGARIVAAGAGVCPSPGRAAMPGAGGPVGRTGGSRREPSWAKQQGLSSLSGGRRP